MVSRSTTKNTCHSQHIPSKITTVFHNAILLKQSQTEMDVINASRKIATVFHNAILLKQSQTEMDVINVSRMG